MIGIEFKFDFIVYFSDSAIGDNLTQLYAKLVASRPEKKVLVKHKTDSWSVEYPTIASYFLSDCLNEFLENSYLHDFSYLYANDIRNLQKSIFVKLTLIAGETMPSLHLNNTVIDFLSQIRCNIDIDLYDRRFMAHEAK